MKYIEVERIPNGIDSVKIENKEFIIRFSARHAQHIIDNFSDSAHAISFIEIISLIKNSIYLPSFHIKKLFVGKHKNKIYETYCKIEKDRIDIITSFLVISRQ